MSFDAPVEGYGRRAEAKPEDAWEAADADRVEKSRALIGRAQKERSEKITSIVTLVLLLLVLIIAVIGYMQATNKLAGTTFTGMTEGGTIAAMVIAPLGIAVILGRMLWKARKERIAADERVKTYAERLGVDIADDAAVAHYAKMYKNDFPPMENSFRYKDHGPHFIALILHQGMAIRNKENEIIGHEPNVSETLVFRSSEERRNHCEQLTVGQDRQNRKYAYAG